MSNNISVFGATGFIGSNWMKMFPDISYAEPRESLSPKNDNILYFRSTNSNYNIFSDPTLDVRTNLLLFTETLKNLTSNHNFCLISSWFVFFPRGFYSATKAAQEQLLESYSLTFNIPFKILRLSNIIGGDFRANKKKNALEYMIGRIKNNEDIELYDGDNYRNFLDIETCLKAIKFVMDNGNNGEIYNIGSSESHRVGDLLNFCIKETGSKSKIKMIETPKFHRQVQIKDFHMDTNKLVDLGFNNKINIYNKLKQIL